MRLLLLAFMIALLPLRGWVGDAMAVEQVSPGQTAVQASAAPGDCHEALAHDGHAEVSQKDHQAAGAHGTGHASGDCTACQLCHSVALAGAVSVAPVASPAMSAPQTQARLHASVERAPGFKPPIS